MTKWTDVQRKVMEVIYADGWESPCIHPGHVWVIDEAGTGRCTVCDSKWTPEAQAVNDDLCHLYRLCYGELPFCGCGNPEAVYLLIRDLLAATAMEAGPPRRARYRELLGEGEGVYFLGLYVLDDAGLTEHGTGIQAAWLTPKGKHYLELMQRYEFDAFDNNQADENGIYISVGFPHGAEDCPPSCRHWCAP